MEQNPIAPQAPQLSTPQIVEHKQQVVTSAPSTAAQNPYDALKDIHKFVAESRVRWIPYKIISEEIKRIWQRDMQEHTLRVWCMTGGVCHEAIKYLEEQISIERKKNIEEVGNKLKDAAIDAIGVISQGVKGNISAMQFQAAQDILDRAGYPKVSKIDQKTKVESDSFEAVANALRAIAEGNQK